MCYQQPAPSRAVWKSCPWEYWFNSQPLRDCPTDYLTKHSLFRAHIVQLLILTLVWNSEAFSSLRSRNYVGSDYKSQVLTCTVVVHYGSFTGTCSLDCIPVFVQNILSSLCLCTEPWAGIIWRTIKNNRSYPGVGPTESKHKNLSLHIWTLFSARPNKELLVSHAAQIQMY